VSRLAHYTRVMRYTNRHFTYLLTYWTSDIPYHIHYYGCKNNNNQLTD